MSDSGDLGETARRLGLAYEQLVANRFRELGYRVVVTPKTGDGGADLLVHDATGNCRFAVQCKAWATAPKVDAVYEIFSALALLRRQGIHPEAGLLVCTTPPTADAKSRAALLGIGIHIINVDGTGELKVPSLANAAIPPRLEPPLVGAAGDLAAAEVAATSEATVAPARRYVPPEQPADESDLPPRAYRQAQPRRSAVWIVVMIAAAAAVALLAFHPNAIGSLELTSGGASGNSGFAIGSPVVTVPAAPTGLHQEGLDSSSVTLAWNASPGATEYVIYQNGSQVGQVSGTQFTTQGLPPDFTGEFSVAAQNAAGTSLATSVSAKTDMAWQDIEARYAASIVRITTYHGILATSVSGGTGWFAASGNGCVIVTDNHVVTGATYYIDVSPGTSPRVQTVIHAHIVRAYAEPDIALLALDNGACGPPLPLAATTPAAAYNVLSVGDPIGVLGLPGLEQVTLTTGSVTAIHQSVAVLGIARQIDMFTFNAGSVGGNSGSPILDHFGHVVGVADCGAATNGNQGCAISLARLLVGLGGG